MFIFHAVNFLFFMPLTVWADDAGPYTENEGVTFANIMHEWKFWFVQVFTLGLMCLPY